jgi:hypothetical protein
MFISLNLFKILDTNIIGTKQATSEQYGLFRQESDKTSGVLGQVSPNKQRGSVPSSTDATYMA